MPSAECELPMTSFARSQTLFGTPSGKLCFPQPQPVKAARRHETEFREVRSQTEFGTRDYLFLLALSTLHSALRKNPAHEGTGFLFPTRLTSDA